MWQDLPTKSKNKYKLLITNFASLSKVFSQKSVVSSNNNITPIVNSKFQETAFQKAFNAISEDISNTSYDASVKLDNNKKYLVGIKSFGYKSGYQKIAQFKRDSASDDWSDLLTKIKENIKNLKPQEATKINIGVYEVLAHKVANLRNARIASSKAQIKGFDGTGDDIESIYHVLMPLNSNNKPQIIVGEIPYSPIDVKKIKIKNNKQNNKHPQNFEFSDGIHDYRYTSSDSQLLMDFKNKKKEIEVERWDINYLEDPFFIFENLHQFETSTSHITALIQDEFSDSVSWMIADENGKLEESSGYNSFDGSTKLSKKFRKERINKIEENYKLLVSKKELSYIISKLEEILLNNWTQSKVDIRKRKVLRSSLVKFVTNLNNSALLEDIEKLVFRSSKEMYIPIPDSKEFHQQRPDFFGKEIGTFKNNSNALALPKESRAFKLEFIPSGNVIEAHITQDLGKAIQSKDNQDILGKWILWEVFQLKERELLTSEKLNDIGINGIRLLKFKDQNRGIGLEFIWIDEENPPEDAIGWVAQNGKKDA